MEIIIPIMVIAKLSGFAAVVCLATTGIPSFFLWISKEPKSWAPLAAGFVAWGGCSFLYTLGTILIANGWMNAY